MCHIGAFVITYVVFTVVSNSVEARAIPPEYVVFPLFAGTTWIATVVYHVITFERIIYKSINSKINHICFYTLRSLT